MTTAPAKGFDEVPCGCFKAMHGLRELSADSQILVLEFELFQAMKRAVDADDRCGRLERKLSNARAQTDVYIERVRELSVRAAGNRASIKSFYEKELRVLQEAYAAVKQRCRDLDDLCRSLLLTIDKAACEDLPTATHASA